MQFLIVYARSIVFVISFLSSSFLPNNIAAVARVIGAVAIIILVIVAISAFHGFNFTQVSHLLLNCFS